jgi:BNR repeat protein
VVQEIARDRVVGPSGSEPDTVVEPYVSVDPRHPNVAVAVFQEGRFPDGGAAAIGFAASRDGGGTWTHGLLPGLTKAFGGEYMRASDPSVAFDADGAAYASTIVIRGPDREEGIAVNRSDDGGRNWNQPVLIQRDPGRAGDDFPRVAVDTAPASSHRGRVYVTYARRDRVVLRWSDDRGATWSALGFVSPGRASVPNVAVGPDGALTVVYGTQRRREPPRLVSRTSRDGGPTFGPQADIGVMRPRASRGLRATGVQELAVDPFDGTLFVVWVDVAKRHDGLNDVVLSRSTDVGATWSSPAKVNPDGSGSGLNHLLPTVAAPAARVRVVYMTREQSAGKPSATLQLNLVTSSNGGATFGEEGTIGPPSDLRFAAQVRPGHTRFVGDYIGVAASSESLLVVWSRSFPPAGVGGYHTTAWAAVIPEDT